VVSLDIFVGVPVSSWESVVVSRPDLDEANASFKHPSGCEAFSGEMDDFLYGVDFFVEGRGDLV
jgi:hypothetical protein